MRYRRSSESGGTWFFTVNLLDRTSDLLLRHIDILREVTRGVRLAHPFEIVAIAVLPEHFHAIWQLPDGDADYPLRWSLIKAGFSRRIEIGEALSASRAGKRERGIWQRRYWEHQMCAGSSARSPASLIKSCRLASISSIPRLSRKRFSLSVASSISAQPAGVAAP